ncbi:MAG: DUF6503 family protein [Marinirhabdus sp.]|nr:DUF6503 family protein [Marinirhabdus sp.]
MRTSALCFCFILMCFGSVTAQLSASEVLERSIAYHDPDDKWKTFNGTFQITMTTPNKGDRVSQITINLPGNYFSVNATRDNVTTRYTIDQGNCDTTFQQENSSGGDPCETAQLYKDYYTYLYGLPMKLKDPGTQISPDVERVSFKGNDYLRIKVTYDEAVGTDVWYFYFNPMTYAMEVYQFYKGDPNSEGKNTGEYILLSEKKVVQGIHMPKVRAWYYNKDDAYLGTDTLTN